MPLLSCGLMSFMSTFQSCIDLLSFTDITHGCFFLNVAKVVIFLVWKVSCIMVLIAMQTLYRRSLIRTSMLMKIIIYVHMKLESFLSLFVLNVILILLVQVPYFYPVYTNVFLSK